MEEKSWHNLAFEEVAKTLKTNLKEGLSEKEVKARSIKFGLNKLPEEKPLSKLTIFLEQFRSPLIYILVLAGIVTSLLEKYTDAIVILSAVFLNTIVGFIQENKASNIARELKKIVKHTARVLRRGKLKLIDSEEVVPGDIIILDPGDKVPADGRIIEAYELKINEMALTGEWLPAKKGHKILDKETSLADRENMVYMGTVVEDGKGKAVVAATGVNTELGKVATMVRETKEEKTPYQKKIAHFSKIVGIIIGVICLGIFAEGMLTGGEFVEMFITAIAVAVAAIPEGLPVAMTVILALGMQRILRKRGLVRKLASAETLGSTSIICTDKTATLTEGKMKVDRVLTISEILKNQQEEKEIKLALKACSVSVEAFIENPDAPQAQWLIRGRPTERALLEAGIKAHPEWLKDLEKNVIAELPFNPINKYSAALYRTKDKEKSLYVCGAPEKILERCSVLTAEEIEKLEKKLEELTQKGLRVVASAYKKMPEGSRSLSPALIKDLIFVGFITLKDPIRKEVDEAIRTCQEAGMRTIIVTGDHKLTAKAVAEELGFQPKVENILTGADLEKLTDEEFEKVFEKIQIYARVEPKHKMRIVRAWQKKGEVVAMTGDGVNDAPALKEADIGVALGSGTEVAKETSDLVLLNDSFSIIVAAVGEGRAILDNIRKIITYLLSDTLTEIILVGTSIFAGLPLPVTAVQILWVNLIEDGLPSVALAFEPKEKDIMKQKPTGQKIPLFTPAMKVIIFIIGTIANFFLLGLFFWLLKINYDITYIRTMVFALLAINSLCYVFSCKSLRRNLWDINILDNKFLVGAWFFGVIVLLAAIYLPALNNLLGTIPLPLSAWSIIISLGILNMVLIEATKYYFITRSQKKGLNRV